MLEGDNHEILILIPPLLPFHPLQLLYTNILSLLHMHILPRHIANCPPLLWPAICHLSAPRAKLNLGEGQYDRVVLVHNAGSIGGIGNDTATCQTADKSICAIWQILLLVADTPCYAREQSRNQSIKRPCSLDPNSAPIPRLDCFCRQASRWLYRPVRSAQVYGPERDQCDCNNVSL